MSPGRPAPTLDPMAAERDISVRHDGRAGIQVVSALAMALAVAAGGFIVSSRSSRPTCEPITYTFEGSPPVHAVSQFELASAEIRQRSGLAFEPGRPNTSKLQIVWSHQGLRVGALPSITSEGQPMRLVGFGTGQWRDVKGGRKLLAATIEIDATAEWAAGTNELDMLTSAFVHELGHVIGLAHSADPTSYMYERISGDPRSWTDFDLEQLAYFGNQVGCSAPLAGR